MSVLRLNIPVFSISRIGRNNRMKHNFSHHRILLSYIYFSFLFIHIYSIETTVVGGRKKNDDAVIESSQDNMVTVAQGDRHARLLTIVVTTTSSVIGYSFIPSKVTSYVTLAGTTSLSCLPSGYTYC